MGEQKPTRLYWENIIRKVIYLGKLTRFIRLTGRRFEDSSGGCRGTDSSSQQPIRYSAFQRLGFGAWRAEVSAQSANEEVRDSQAA